VSAVSGFAGERGRRGGPEAPGGRGNRGRRAELEGPGGRGPGRDRGGYTLAQVAIAVVVLATVVRLGMPHVDRWRAEARAEEARERITTIAGHVRAHLDRAETWPSDAAPGEAPGELAEALGDVDFAGDGYQLDWESFPLPDGLPSVRGVQRVGGVVFRSDDDAVLAALRSHAWSADGWLVGEDRVVRVVVPPE